MDDQAARARHAMANDCAFWMVEESVQEIGTAVDLVMRPEVHDLIRSNCLSALRNNGGELAASLIERLTLEPAELLPASTVGSTHQNRRAAS
jgi:hypothetical protein